MKDECSEKIQEESTRYYSRYLLHEELMMITLYTGNERYNTIENVYLTCDLVLHVLVFSSLHLDDLHEKVMLSLRCPCVE